MLSRMLGAARLSVDTFEDVERDSSATIQALIVVIIVALASGIGELLSGEADILRALVFGLIRGNHKLGDMGAHRHVRRHQDTENRTDRSRLGTVGKRHRVRPNSGYPDCPSVCSGRWYRQSEL